MVPATPSAAPEAPKASQEPQPQKVVTTAATPDVAGTPAEAAPPAPKVKLVPTDAVKEYPVSVSLVGLEKEIVFADADASAEVTPAVAEQVRYLANVEVAA